MSGLNGLNGFVVETGTLFSVKGKSTFSDVAVKMVHASYAKDFGAKDDCLVEDESGNISSIFRMVYSKI